MRINLNQGQWRGTIAIGIAFALTAVAGIGLSFLAANWEALGLFIAGSIIFLVLSPIYAYGIYTFARHSQEEAPAEDMTLGRQLLDLLGEGSLADIETLSRDLGTNPQEIKRQIDDLSRLELFNGIIDWEAGNIARLQPLVVASIENCKHCGKTISIQRGISICQNCGTEYHYY